MLTAAAIVLPAVLGIFLAPMDQGLGKKELIDQIGYGQGQDKIDQYVLKRFHLDEDLIGNQCYKVGKAKN